MQKTIILCFTPSGHKKSLASLGMQAAAGSRPQAAGSWQRAAPGGPWLLGPAAGNGNRPPAPGSGPRPPAPSGGPGPQASGPRPLAAAHGLRPLAPGPLAPGGAFLEKKKFGSMDPRWLGNTSPDGSNHLFLLEGWAAGPRPPAPGPRPRRPPAPGNAPFQASLCSALLRALRSAFLDRSPRECLSE